jgi:hypothetical protein
MSCLVHTFVRQSCDECSATVELEHLYWGESFYLRLPSLGQLIFLRHEAVRPEWRDARVRSIDDPVIQFTSAFYRPTRIRS